MSGAEIWRAQEAGSSDPEVAVPRPASPPGLFVG
jgi:hypothetical protein